MKKIILLLLAFLVGFLGIFYLIRNEGLVPTEVVIYNAIQNTSELLKDKTSSLIDFSDLDEGVKGKVNLESEMFDGYFNYNATFNYDQDSLLSNVTLESNIIDELTEPLLIPSSIIHLLGLDVVDANGTVFIQDDNIYFQLGDFENTYYVPIDTINDYIQEKPISDDINKIGGLLASQSIDIDFGFGDYWDIFIRFFSRTDVTAKGNDYELQVNNINHDDLKFLLDLILDNSNLVLSDEQYNQALSYIDSLPYDLYLDFSAHENNGYIKDLSLKINYMDDDSISNLFYFDFDMNGTTRVNLIINAPNTDLDLSIDPLDFDIQYNDSNISGVFNDTNNGINADIEYLNANNKSFEFNLDITDDTITIENLKSPDDKLININLLEVTLNESQLNNTAPFDTSTSKNIVDMINEVQDFAYNVTHPFEDFEWPSFFE